MKIVLVVRGKNHWWMFSIEGSPENLQEWRDDGLEVCELITTIPAWWIDAGHTPQEWLDRNN